LELRLGDKPKALRGDWTNSPTIGLRKEMCSAANADVLVNRHFAISCTTNACILQPKPVFRVQHLLQQTKRFALQSLTHSLLVTFAWARAPAWRALAAFQFRWWCLILIVRMLQAIAQLPICCSCKIVIWMLHFKACQRTACG